VLIVSEAMHETAAEDIARLVETLAAEIQEVWSVEPVTSMLTPERPRFDV
jgi:hypothetical protein